MRYSIFTIGDRKKALFKGNIFICLQAEICSQTTSKQRYQFPISKRIGTYLMKIRNAIPNITPIIFIFSFSVFRQVKTDCLISFIFCYPSKSFSRLLIGHFPVNINICFVRFRSPDNDRNFPDIKFCCFHLSSPITSYHQRIKFSIYCHLQKCFLPTETSTRASFRMHGNPKERSQNYDLSKIISHI